MKTSTAILVATAVAAAGFWRAGNWRRQSLRLAEEQHQQQLRLGTARLHQEMLTSMEADPEHWAIWAKDGRSPEQMGEFIRVNKQISYHHVSFELGLVTEAELRVRARSVMERDAVRRFWADTRAFRAEETQSPLTTMFMEIFDREYVAAILRVSKAVTEKASA
ncbi:DUF6082 family protein [Streptomyces hydrogenans]|uniref:DUF6082 family protein n=1 Tax=Streptomyces hydrogenans TaxID=1873719 RepID=UPI0036E64C52